MSRIPWLICLSFVAALGGRGLPMGPAGLAPAGSGTPPMVRTSGVLGGVTQDMVFVGRQVWFGTGTSVTAADLSVPAEPRVIGRSPQLAGIVSAVAVSGNRLFAAAGAAGLVVLDISAPDRPRVTAVLATSAPARDVAVAGARALVAAEGAGLLVVDVTAPDRPRLLGAHATSQLAARVVTAANHAYVLTLRHFTGGGGDYYTADQIEVFNLAGPVGGPAVSSFPSSDVAGAPEGPLAVIGTSLVVGVGRLSVFSLAQPGQPEPLAALEIGTLPRDIAILPGAPQALVAGGRGHPDGGTVVQVDFANPSKPVAVATWLGSEAGQPTVAASGDVFCLGQPTGGLLVATLAQQSPSGGPIQPAGTLPALADVVDADARAGRAYLAAGVGGFAVAEADGAGNLAVVGRLLAAPGGAVVTYQDVELPAEPVDAPPDRAYVLSATGDVASFALQVLDVSTPGQPVELGRLSASRPYSALAVGTRYAYAGKSDGFDVIDLADPANLKVGTPVAVTRGVEDLALAGKDLYAVSSQQLTVYDVTTPDKPRARGWMNMSGDDKVLVVAGGRAYVGLTPATGAAGRLNIVDVSTPSQPALKFTVSLPGPPISVQVHGERVLVGLRSTGQHGVDDQPQILTVAQDFGISPRVTGGTRLGDDPHGLTVLGSRAWAAAGAAGLVPLQPGALLSLPLLRR